MTAQEAYAIAFCKTAEAYGVDPETLAQYAMTKHAFEDRDHLGGAIEGLIGGGAGGLIGGGLGGMGYGALVSNTGAESLKELINNPKLKVAPTVMGRHGVLAKDFTLAQKLLRSARKGSKLSALRLALLKAKGPAAVWGLLGAGLGLGSGALGGMLGGGIIGKKKKKD